MWKRNVIYTNEKKKERKHKKYELSLMHKILAKLAGPDQFTE